MTVGMSGLGKLRAFVPVLFFGIFMLAAGILLLSVAGPREDRVKTEGIIEDISYTHSGIDEVSGRVTVTYEVEGVAYREELGDYSSTWDVGDGIDLYYLPDDPHNVTTGLSYTLPIIATVAGAVLVLVGGVGVAFTIARARKRAAAEPAFPDTTGAFAPGYAGAGYGDAFSNRNAAQEESADATHGNIYTFGADGYDRRRVCLFDENGNAVCAAKVLKRGFLFKPALVEFSNSVTAYRRERKIGTTFTVTEGRGYYATPKSSSFKADGVNCWEVIQREGFTLVPAMRGGYAGIDVFRAGERVAEIIPAIRQGVFGIPAARPAGFRVTCEEEALDGVFFICYALANTDTVAPGAGAYC